MNLKKPAEVLLLGPGPSPVHERILKAMGRHTLGHLDPDFLTIMNEAMDLLRFVFETKNLVTFPVSGTGSAGMETALVNMIEPKDRVIIAVNGVFGQRMVDVASRCGAEVVEVKAEWGNPVDPQDIEKKLSLNPGIKLVGIVHAETSTGVHQPLDAIVEIAHNHDALIMVDAVTSLGGLPVEVDRRNLDIVYSGNQKCLGAPPGLAPITFGEKALKVFKQRINKVQSWYLDLSFLTRYWGEERFYHHTAPVNMIYALHESLSMIKEEGLEERFKRHRLNSKAITAGLKVLGIEPVVEEKYRLPSLITTWIPANIDDFTVRSRLRKESLIEIGGGLGPFKGKAWRIGLMGNGSKRANVEYLLKALGNILNDLGHRCSVKDALFETSRVYQQQ